MPFVRFPTDFTRLAWVKSFAAALDVPPIVGAAHLIALASTLAEETNDGSWGMWPSFLVAEWGEWSGPAMKFMRALDSEFPSHVLPDWDSINKPQIDQAKDTRRKAGRIPRDKIGIPPVNGMAGKSYGLAGDIFQAAWNEYPKRAGGNSRPDAWAKFLARVREGVDPMEMLAGVRRYRKYCDATGVTGTQFVKQAATFFGTAEHWKDLFEIQIPKGNKPRPQVYSYGENPTSPPNGSGGQAARTVGIVGHREPQVVGREGVFEITEPD